MRFLLRILLLFAAAAGLAVLARFNPGNVVVFYPPYRVDLSLNFFLALLVLTFFTITVLVRALRVTLDMPRRVAAYRNEKRDRTSNRALRDALKFLFEGRFGHAEKAATRASASPDNAGLAALIGARAAHWMHEYERRETWLAKTTDEPSLKIARLMTSLELLVDEHQYERAMEAVNQLNTSGVRHLHALRLALKANQQAGNWSEVLRLLQTLEKHNALHPALSTRLRELAYDALLTKRSHDGDELRAFWNQTPLQDRVKPYVAVRAAYAFNLLGMHDEARSLIERALGVEWDSRLVRIYRDCAAEAGSPALLAQIERCENWLGLRSGDAELALTLGALCLRQRLWGKAQHHLEQSLSRASDANTLMEAHLKLAALHEALSRPEQAAEHYRQCALAANS